jgi:hypothetical protein
MSKMSKKMLMLFVCVVLVCISMTAFAGMQLWMHPVAWKSRTPYHAWRTPYSNTPATYYMAQIIMIYSSKGFTDARWMNMCGEGAKDNDFDGHVNETYYCSAYTQNGSQFTAGSTCWRWHGGDSRSGWGEGRMAYSYSLANKYDYTRKFTLAAFNPSATPITDGVFGDGSWIGPRDPADPRDYNPANPGPLYGHTSGPVKLVSKPNGYFAGYLARQLYESLMSTTDTTLLGGPVPGGVLIDRAVLGSAYSTSGYTASTGYWEASLKGPQGWHVRDDRQFQVWYVKDPRISEPWWGLDDGWGWHPDAALVNGLPVTASLDWRQHMVSEFSWTDGAVGGMPGVDKYDGRPGQIDPCGYPSASGGTNSFSRTHADYPTHRAQSCGMWFVDVDGGTGSDQFIYYRSG